MALLDAALDLVRASVRGFVIHEAGRARMIWKASTDLSRALVPSMGAHDPLDGLLTLCTLRVTADQDPGLDEAIEALAGLVHGHTWATDDPLGLGSLLVDLERVRALREVGVRTPTMCSST